MNILVVGAGAVGGYLGAKLVLAGAHVTFVAHGEHGLALRERGLVIRGGSGPELRTAALNVVEMAQVAGRYDVILVAVKSTGLEAVCDELPNWIAPHGVVLPLQNGLDSEDFVAGYVGAQRTIASVVYMSGARTAPGELHVTEHTKVGLAPYRDGQEPDIARLVGLFEKAGIAAQMHEHWQAMLWQKMVWNAPFNALCALTNKPAAEALARNPELVREAMDEVMRVALAEGVRLDPELPERMISITEGPYADTVPSMLQDVRAGRATEVEILQGAVVSRGKRLGVDTPVLRTLAALLRGL